ncbi:MAG: PorT family protein [Chitinophagales bacterium]|nr:PorT family protein [Chitinophagales bacterium]
MKQRLEEYSVEPPDSLWNKIEQQLPPTTPWYDKYKYLLLLLLLISTSVGSVLVYENWIKPQPNNFISEQVTTNNNSNIKQKNNNETNTVSNNTEIDKNTNNNQTVNQNTAANNTNTKNNASTNKSATLTAINSTQKTSVQQHQNNINQYKKVSNNSINQYQANNMNTSSINKNSTSNKTKNQAKNTKQSSSKTTNNTSIADANNASNNYDEQYTSTIERRKENTANTQLLASIDVSNIEVQKLSTTEVLASLVSQKASINTNKTVAGIDELAAEKEAMLQNLNEFAGYDINKGFHFGALLGLHTNFMDKNVIAEEQQVSSFDNKIDFGKAFGVNIGYDFSSRYGFQTEIQYNEAGKTFMDNSNGSPIKKEVNLNYLKVPLLFKYKISYINNYNSKPIVLNFLAGPQASFLIGKSYEVDGKENNLDMINYSKTNVGFAGGVDIDLYMKRNFYFTIGARTSADFSLKKGNPNNYQVGITTQFNFRMPKKIK